MSASAPGARLREDVAARLRRGAEPGPQRPSRLVATCAHRDFLGRIECSLVDLADSTRVAMMLAPRGRGALREQAIEVLAALRAILERQSKPMAVTVQTVFLRDERDRRECEQLLATHYGSRLPVTNFVSQAPCCGAALALEAWAIGGEDVRVEHFGPQALAVSYDSVRWVNCAGVESTGPGKGVYAETLGTLEQMRSALTQAGAGFEDVVRTWFYLGGITEPEAQTERYRELNRARADFYRKLSFRGPLLEPGIPHEIYPASTGIGMSGNGLAASCLTLQTTRQDALLVALENPQQTPAYAYHPRYSPQSPKFSRAMALVLGHYVTTWISGTASIVKSESRHPDDIEKQTEQTIDNIERLIAPETFAFHGVRGGGARLHDLAKVRVYLKRAEDFARCKAVCERRFGALPAIYAVADVCRPELLVEIEGVAFSRYPLPP
jgi:enamine deaminase RidA (YjgF/YER057c/UK114 family)